jgi:hypothetical protein
MAMLRSRRCPTGSVLRASMVKIIVQASVAVCRRVPEPYHLRSFGISLP